MYVRYRYNQNNNEMEQLKTLISTHKLVISQQLNYLNTSKHIKNVTHNTYVMLMFLQMSLTKCSIQIFC